jgi:regulatory protein
VAGGKSDPASARRTALDLLARRDHSLAELREKLAAREFSPADIEETLARLTGDGLASDARFVEAFVAARVRKGQGPVRIRAELERRGVAADIIARHLEAEACDWGALAGEVRVRRFGAAHPRDFRERARQARFLEYRGFTADQIRAALGGRS